MMSMPRSVRVSFLAILAATVAVAAGCAPLPDASPRSSSATSAAASPRPSSHATSSASESPSPSTTATAGFSLPDSCESIYSAGMLATLEDQSPPLNDPGITIYSTENVDALEVLTSGIPTLRCSWGTAGGSGLVTNVSVVTDAESADLSAAFTAAGMGCGTYGGGTICRIQQETVDRQDNVVTTGETHYLRDNAWISTHWVNYGPEGYTEDIVDTLWG